MSQVILMESDSEWKIKFTRELEKRGVSVVPESASNAALQIIIAADDLVLEDRVTRVVQAHTKYPDKEIVVVSNLLTVAYILHIAREVVGVFVKQSLHSDAEWDDFVRYLTTKRPHRS